MIYGIGRNVKMKQMIDLTKRRILVTGASSGIGRETAILLSELGAEVVLIGRNEERLASTVSQMQGEKHSIIAYDLKNIEGIEELIQSIVNESGKRLDGMVHCAGMTRITSLRMLDYKKLEEVMRVNFYSFVELVKQYSNKKNNNGGSIVAVSSVAALKADKGQIAYGSSKAAVNTAIIAMAKELAKKNIRVNGVMPGFIRTQMSEDFFLKAGDEVDTRQLLGIGAPIDVANMIAFLLSDASKFVTGANFRVDGGKY